MRLSLLVVPLLFLAATVRAQEVTTLIVPVVGSTFGPTMIRWRTDVDIANPTALETDVAIELAAIPDAPVFAFTLAPGQSQHFTDIITQAFGLDSALSPLRVTTPAHHSVLVRASAYALRDAEVSPLQPIDVYSRNTWYPIRALDGLEFSDEYRTNIGLANTGDRDADFLLALQRVPGRNLALTHVRVGANSLQHTSIQSLFPLITSGSGFSVVVETASRDTHVYASVIENATNAAKFVASSVGIR